MPHADRIGLAPERERIRVLHVITGLAVGGAERMLVNLVTGSHPGVFSHVVLALTPGGRYADQLREAGVELHVMNFRGVKGLAGLFKCLSIVRRVKPDIIQTWLYHADFVGLVVGLLAGRRVVWNLRCSNMDLRQYRSLNRWMVRLLALTSGLPVAVLSNSEAGRQWHQSLGYRPKRWAIIGNGVDASRFCPNPEARLKWRQRLGVAGTDILVGMIARRDPMKDHEGFLEAATIIARPGIAFVLAGRQVETSPELRQLAKTCPSKVYLLSECDDVAGLMAALDISVTASRFGEGFPNVLIEAMAVGLPCVATDVGDAAAVLGDTGVVVPPSSPTILAAAVAGLVDDSRRRNRLGAAARERVEAHFTVGSAVANFETFYRSLMREG